MGPFAPLPHQPLAVQSPHKCTLLPAPAAASGQPVDLEAEAYSADEVDHVAAGQQRGVRRGQVAADRVGEAHLRACVGAVRPHSLILLAAPNQRLRGRREGTGSQPPWRSMAALGLRSPPDPAAAARHTSTPAHLPQRVQRARVHGVRAGHRLGHGPQLSIRPRQHRDAAQGCGKRAGGGCRCWRNTISTWALI